MEILFALGMSLSSPGPSVHLLKDVIKTFEEDKLFSTTIFEKNFTINEITKIDNHINFPFKKTNKRLLFSRYTKEIHYLQEIIKYIEENHLTFDVVFVQSSPVAYILINYFKKNSKSKIVYNVQDIFPDNAMLLSQYSKLFLLPFLKKTLDAYNNSDLIITISDDMRDTLSSKGISKEKIVTIYNWAPKSEQIKKDNFNYFYQDERLANKFIVLYAGNIGRFQDVGTIIKAANLIKNDSIIFVVMGDGALSKNIAKRAKSNKNRNLVFLPPQSFGNMPLIYSSANVNIISLRRGVFKTALPSKLAFCLNAGKPIILSIENYSKIVRYFLNDESVTICEPENPNQLAQSIVNVHRTFVQNGFSSDIKTKNEAITSIISDKNYLKYKNAILRLLNL
ncbi:MAG: glycosyltransferase family 4 protein [Erysipelotrichia bacterium]|jgi:glycosyltransferase involved in cell wall biosynthesis|nr:glycosyltransferase family 4 protein [Erysipelotrichia bacterium]